MYSGVLKQFESGDAGCPGPPAGRRQVVINNVQHYQLGEYGTQRVLTPSPFLEAPRRRVEIV
jgi:hypothetical protein